MKYNEKAEIVPDLIKDYEIKDDGKLYEITLKNNIFWHDGEKLTADDVVFTIATIQNPKIKTPLITSWQNVEIKKVDNYKVKIILPNSFAPFLEVLANTPILPKHIYKNKEIKPELLLINNKIIGSGPYLFQSLEKNKKGEIISIILKANEKYYLKKPFIEYIKLYFYRNENELLKDLVLNKIDGFANLPPNSLKFLNKKRFQFFKILKPEYYAVFFNQSKNLALSDINVRQALNYATDKKRIVKEALFNEALISNSLFPKFFNFASTTHKFSIEKAKNILEKENWKLNKENIRIKRQGKKEIKLTIKLTILNREPFKTIANILKENWEKIGAQINIEEKDLISIQEIIKNRKFEAILFGEILGSDPDPFVFWHSSQKKYPGLNISMFYNPQVDEILEEARQSLDRSIRENKYKKIQSIINQELPAIFLYSPIQIYVISKKVQNVKILKLSYNSKRFSNIYNWYIKIKRVKK